MSYAQGQGTRIRVEGLTKAFGPVRAVDGVSFELAGGAFGALLGPSGSGKTTILRCIAGLEQPTGGRILLGDQEATYLPAHRRGLGYVFQRASMFPTYTVAENIAWGLRLRRLPQEVIAARVAELVRLLHLEGLEGRYVGQLSGGQAQRVAIARALAPDPAVLLLDEPLSALDARLRDELKDAIAEVHRRTHKTTLMVTHDQREALALADEVIVLDGGAIVQSGPPAAIYRRPASIFVAGFVGQTNLVRARVIERLPDGRLVVACLGGELIAPATPGLEPGAESLASIRPDDLELVEEGERQRHRHVFEGAVRQMVFNGDMVRLDLTAGDDLLRVHVSGPRRFALIEGRPERVLFAAGEVALLPA